MSLFGAFSKGVKELYIARPDGKAGCLAWRHPHKNIPRGAKVTVRSDEQAVFFREGRFAGDLAAGSYVLDSANLPFLGSMLIDPITGGNHYLAELFFVLAKEYLHRLECQPLGTYRDRESRNVVEVSFDVQFALRVADPIAFITTLAGMSPDPDEEALRFVTGRLTSAVQESVGNLFNETDALDVVSNRFNDRVGREAREKVKDDFRAQGLEITRFISLKLSLDAASSQRLREFGAKLSENVVMGHGAQVAGGLDRFVAAKAQGAVAEGLGKGLATGGGPMIMTGGLGAFAPTPPAPAAPARPPVVAGASNPVLVSPSGDRGAVPAIGLRWHLRTPRGVEGPFTARQLANTAASHGLDAETAGVRRADETHWHPASDDPTLLTEFERSSRSSGPATATGGRAVADAFEQAFRAAVADGVVSDEELRLLATLAVGAGVVAAPQAGEEYVRRRARAVGATMRSAPPPATGAVPTEPPTVAAPPSPAPPLPSVVGSYHHHDGKSTVEGLTAEAVAARVAQNPEGVHLVWAPGLPGWKRAIEVEEIRARVGQVPPPLPPM